MVVPARQCLIVRLGVLSLCAVLACGLSGCATSEKAAFMEHLNATVPAGPGARDDVVIAFADWVEDVPASAVARGEDQQPHN